MGRVPHSFPSADELYNRNDTRVGRNGGYGISKASAAEQQRKLLQGEAEGVAAPLPTPWRGGAGKTGLAAESRAIFNDAYDTAAGMGYDITAGEYLNYDANGNLTVPDYTNFANDARVGADMESAASLSIRPTSSSNPRKPRTYAAGYDPDRKVLTVVFRDGTFYNYYEVGKQMWESFRGAYSKGWYIKRWLDAKPRGMADMSNVSARAMEEQIRISRTNQILFDANQNYRTPSQVRRNKKFERDTIGEANKRKGKNPATAGKAHKPHKP